MQLFYDITQNTPGAVVISLIPTLIAMAGNAAGLAATSRTFWSFARDSAIPQDEFFAHVLSRFRILLRMVLLVSFLELLFGLISLGSTTALNAILSMAVTGMCLSYAMPICYMLYARRKATVPAFGPFRMRPRAGVAVNILALVYLVLVIFFSTWPVTYPVTSQTMNYSIVVLSGWTIIGGAYYLLRGRRKYKNPIITTSTFR